MKTIGITCLLALAIGAAGSSASLAAAPSTRPVRVLVTNERSGNVSVIDTSTNQVTATIQVGTRPRGIRVSADGKLAFVAVSATAIGGPPSSTRSTQPTQPATSKQAEHGKDGIAVIDLEANQLRETLPSGRDPENLSLSPDGGRVYISNEDTSQASVLDLGTKKLLKVFSVGEEPEGVATSPDGKRVYITCESTSDVYAIDTTALAIAGHFSTPGRPRGAAFLPDGSKAYITCETGGAICVADPETARVVHTIKPKGENIWPMGIVVAPDGKHVYVTTGRGGSVIEIDASSDTISHRIDGVGPRPWGIGITPDAETLYTANGPSNDVSVIDVKTAKVTGHIPCGASPWGIAIAP